MPDEKQINHYDNIVQAYENFKKSPIHPFLIAIAKGIPGALSNLKRRVSKTSYQDKEEIEKFLSETPELSPMAKYLILGFLASLKNNTNEIYQYYKLSADQGSADAFYELGNLTANKYEAKNQIRKAADLGCPDALVIFENKEFLEKLSQHVKHASIYNALAQYYIADRTPLLLADGEMKEWNNLSNKVKMMFEAALKLGDENAFIHYHFYLSEMPDDMRKSVFDNLLTQVNRQNPQVKYILKSLAHNPEFKRTEEEDFYYRRELVLRNSITRDDNVAEMDGPAAIKGFIALLPLLKQIRNKNVFYHAAIALASISNEEIQSLNLSSSSLNKELIPALQLSRELSWTDFATSLYHCDKNNTDPCLLKAIEKIVNSKPVGLNKDDKKGFDEVNAWLAIKYIQTNEIDLTERALLRIKNIQNIPYEYKSHIGVRFLYSNHFGNDNTKYSFAISAHKINLTLNEIYGIKLIFSGDNKKDKLNAICHLCAVLPEKYNFDVTQLNALLDHENDGLNPSQKDMLTLIKMIETFAIDKSNFAKHPLSAHFAPVITDRLSESFINLLKKYLADNRGTFSDFFSYHSAVEKALIDFMKGVKFEDVVNYLETNLPPLQGKPLLSAIYLLEQTFSSNESHADVKPIANAVENIIKDYLHRTGLDQASWTFFKTGEFHGSTGRAAAELLLTEITSCKTPEKILRAVNKFIDNPNHQSNQNSLKTLLKNKLSDIEKLCKETAKHEYREFKG